MRLDDPKLIAQALYDLDVAKKLPQEVYLLVYCDNLGNIQEVFLETRNDVRECIAKLSVDYHVFTLHEITHIAKRWLV